MGRITSRIAAAVVLTRPGVATEEGQANATPVSSRANRAVGRGSPLPTSPGDQNIGCSVNGGRPGGFHREVPEETQF